MGVSGNLYPIGSYPYAQNDLKNLCWTLSNLREEGAGYTSYAGKSPSRGYYYLKEVATAASDNICTQQIGVAWRVPTEDEWNLLKDGLADFTIDELNDWVGAPNGGAGKVGKRMGNCLSDVWEGWDEFGAYRISWTAYNSASVMQIYKDRHTETSRQHWTNVDSNNCACNGNYAPCSGMSHLASIRCVRDL
jgi:hypothetical protein